MWGGNNKGFMMFGGHKKQEHNPWQQQNQWGNNKWGGHQSQPYQEFYTIKGKQSGRALDISKANESKGQTILWDIHGGDNQMFTIEMNGQGQCQIKNKEGAYVTVEGNNSNNQAKIVGAQNQHQPGQVFELVPVQGEEETFYIKTFCGKCVDVYGHNKDNGAIVNQWEYNGGENQKWIIHHTHKGNKNKNVGHQKFSFKSKHSGRALDVSQAPNTKDHTIIWDYHGGDNQKFRLQQNPMGLYSIKCHDGRYLTIAQNSHDNGAKCVAHKWNGQAGQLFELVPVQGDKNCYFIKTFAGKCLDVYGNKKDNETIVCQWEYNGQDNQKWYLVQ